MATTLLTTDFNFPGQKSVYHGKVRDVYDINDDILVMVATDRISAFDVVLPKGSLQRPGSQQIAAKFLDATSDIVPNWKIATPDPMVTVGYKCEGLRVEMIIRGYLTGSAWREYAAGCREICGVKLPDGMRENQRFPRTDHHPHDQSRRRPRREHITRGDHSPGARQRRGLRHRRALHTPALRAWNADGS